MNILNSSWALPKNRDGSSNIEPSRLSAPLGARRGECGLTLLIRRGGAPSGAAALLARGGVGATAPAIPADPSGFFSNPPYLNRPGRDHSPTFPSKSPPRETMVLAMQEKCRSRTRGGGGTPPPHPPPLLSIKVGVTLPPMCRARWGYPLPHQRPAGRTVTFRENAGRPGSPP